MVEKLKKNSEKNEWEEFRASTRARLNYIGITLAISWGVKSCLSF